MSSGESEDEERFVRKNSLPFNQFRKEFRRPRPEEEDEKYFADIEVPREPRSPGEARPRSENAPRGTESPQDEEAGYLADVDIPRENISTAGPGYRERELPPRSGLPQEIRIHRRNDTWIKIELDKGPLPITTIRTKKTVEIGIDEDISTESDEEGAAAVPQNRKALPAPRSRSQTPNQDEEEIPVLDLTKRKPVCTCTQSDMPVQLQATRPRENALEVATHRGRGEGSLSISEEIVLDARSAEAIRASLANLAVSPSRAERPELLPIARGADAPPERRVMKFPRKFFGCDPPAEVFDLVPELSETQGLPATPVSETFNVINMDGAGGAHGGQRPGQRPRRRTVFRYVWEVYTQHPCEWNIAFCLVFTILVTYVALVVLNDQYHQWPPRGHHDELRLD